MQAHPTLEYPKIKGGRTYVEAPGQLPSLPSPKSGPDKSLSSFETDITVNKIVFYVSSVK